MPLPFAGGILLWLAREPVARLATGTADHADDVGFLGIRVWLTVIAASQLAVLQGYRRIGALARVKLWVALLGSLVGIGLVFWLRHDGSGRSLGALANVLAAHYYHPSFPKWAWRDIKLQALSPFGSLSSKSARP